MHPSSLPRGAATGALTVTAVLVLAARPAGAECKRWVNALTACDGLVAMPACQAPESTWTAGQVQSFYNWKHSSTAHKACVKEVMKTFPGEEDLAFAHIISEEFAICFYDFDGDGAVLVGPGIDLDGDGFPDDGDGDGMDDDDWSSASILNRNPIVRQPECELVPNGPYAAFFQGTPVPGDRLGKFPDAQRQALLSRNHAVHGGFRSDAGSAGSTGIGDTNVLTSSRIYTFSPYEDDAEIDDSYQLPASLTNQAQIDHIIPRVDLYGCPCGTNSWANAAVISSTLNRKMSNNLRDPDRIKMLQAFVPGYVPPAPRTSAPADDAAPPDDPDTSALALLAADDAPATAHRPDAAGCATGRGATGPATLGLLGLALALGARRRRARD